MLLELVLWTAFFTIIVGSATVWVKNDLSTCTA